MSLIGFLALTSNPFSPTPASAAAVAEAAEPAEAAATAAAPAALRFYPPELAAMLGPVVVSTFPQVFPWYPEELEFEVKWGFIKAGKATLSMADRVTLMGRPAYRLISQAVSSRFIDRFHKVRDYNESWMEVGQMRSLGYFKHMREGTYGEDTFVVYDHNAKTFKSRKVRLDRPLKEVTGPIPPKVQDVLSALYYTRTKELKVGGEYVLDVNTGENWPMLIKVLRKATIKVPMGTYDCLVVQPVLREQGIFIQKGHDMLIWMTDDGRHTPVHVEVEVFIGHISANLVRAVQAPVPVIAP
jgi:hypothetical protein